MGSKKTNTPTIFWNTNDIQRKNQNPNKNTNKTPNKNTNKENTDRYTNLTLCLKRGPPPILSLLRSLRLLGRNPRFLRTTTSESELSVRWARRGRLGETSIEMGGKQFSTQRIQRNGNGKTSMYRDLTMARQRKVCMLIMI